MKSATIIAFAGLVAITAVTQTAAGSTLTLDVSGLASWGFQGDPANDRLDVFVGGPQPPLVWIAWDLNLSTVGISWAEEMTIGLLGSSFLINPAMGDAFSVTNQNYQGGMDASQIGMNIGIDGILDFEFFETDWDDNPDAIDSYFEAGSTITLTFMPTPGPLAVLGLGGLIITRRRR